MSSSIQYEQLSTRDTDEDGLLGESENNNNDQIAAGTTKGITIEDAVDVVEVDEEEGKKEIVLRHEKPYPISRPPPQSRDVPFAIIFLLHFLAVLLLSLIEQSSLQHSLINYGRAGSWASMLMIVTLLGSFLGAVISMLIGSFSESREAVLGIGITFSLILKIAVGNILLIMRSKYSIFGVFILISAVIDAFRIKSAKENLLVTSALIQMTLDSTKVYNLGFFITCSAIVFAQTCILLWWGAFFIGMLSTVDPAYAELCAFFMLLSLLWITSFFQSVMSFVVGGCILWLFVKEEHEPIKASKKLFLYLQCSFTTSLGSLCKGALFVPLSQFVLTLYHWNNGKRQQSLTNCSSVFASCVLCFTKPFLQLSQKNHRLTYALIATYGKTFSKTAEDHCADYPETLDICIEDSTYYTLNCIAVVVSSLISILFSLFAEKREGSSWPLFFFICFYLSYCGLSLTIHIYSSAVDALIVASALNPIRFAKGNQIIFLRFLRTSETQLR